MTTTPSSIRRWYLWPYMACLFALMWLPLNGLEIGMDNYVLGIRIDHLYHATIYLPCATLLLPHVGHRWKRTWLIALAIALTTEFGQRLLPYRGFDINDLIANTIGVTAGVLPLWYRSHRSHRQH